MPVPCHLPSSTRFPYAVTPVGHGGKHQTLARQEALAQLEMAGEYPRLGVPAFTARRQGALQVWSGRSER